MRHFTLPLVLIALTLNAALFGFFYAWVCSTMWGLDATDPRVAITAMQAMNTSVRNAVFAPTFFGTPFALLAAAGVLWITGARASSLAFAVAGSGVLILGTGLTLAVNVPMNEALAQVPDIADRAEAAQIWADYSPDWQFWNQVRTIATGASFLIAAYGATLIRPARASV